MGFDFSSIINPYKIKWCEHCIIRALFRTSLSGKWYLKAAHNTKIQQQHYHSCHAIMWYLIQLETVKHAHKIRSCKYGLLTKIFKFSLRSVDQLKILSKGHLEKIWVTSIYFVPLTLSLTSAPVRMPFLIQVCKKMLEPIFRNVHPGNFFQRMMFWRSLAWVRRYRISQFQLLGSFFFFFLPLQSSLIQIYSPRKESRHLKWTSFCLTFNFW